MINLFTIFRVLRVFRAAPLRTQKCLTIGYTKDIELAEQVARATGAKELIIETRPEGDTLMLSTE